VGALYANVLHRPAEGAGYDFWLNALHTASRADVLANFSESGENQAQVIGRIQNGIDYLHWG
jgi:serralysin